MTSQVRNLRCRSIGVREATDLIGLVSVSGRVGGGGFSKVGTVPIKVQRHTEL